MGFYLRKSVSVGPFRFSLSGTGVRVSVGTRGFRIGAGPRGSSVHLGAGGVYYRHTLIRAKPRRLSPRPLATTGAVLFLLAVLVTGWPAWAIATIAVVCLALALAAPHRPEGDL